ncbi:MAG TPA: tyrosine-type recombinase/integrase [Pirellulales bacterium]
MNSTGKRGRQRHGSAWYWKQTGCWYFTPTGTKKRVPLVDEQGRRIRGQHSKQAASLALARIKLQTDWRPEPETDPAATALDIEPWLVARVCSVYLARGERRVQVGAIVAEYHQSAVRYLNELCKYCGALPVSGLKKGHIQFWVDSHSKWRPATQRNVIGIVLAAFNHAQDEYGIRNPLRGLKKPPSTPRLQSFSPEDEHALYASTDGAFQDFLFVAIHTGLRPFCELAKLTADDVELTPRGMLWRVYSSKTKRTRKIPVRPEVAAVVRRLMKTAPRGSKTPLWRNSQNNPWKKVTGRARFLALKRKLGWDSDAVRRGFSCYTCRHTFAHRMLSGFWNRGAGCSIEVLAELMGNTPKVAFDHYGREWGQHYQEPLWAALGTGQ